MQPIKKSIDYKNYFSNELKHLLDTMMSTIINEIPTNEITSLYFINYALGNKDSLLYTAVNAFLNTFTIEEIQDELSLLIQENNLLGLRPRRTIEYSQEFSNYLSKSCEEKDKMNCNTITSDIVLLSILNDSQSNTVKTLFNKKGLTYDILLDKCFVVHSIINTTDNANNNNDLNKIQPKPVSKKIKRKVNYCDCLNDASLLGKITPLIGREKEIKSIEKIFLKRYCNNVILVGDSGVGKTAIVNGLANMIENDICPPSFNHTQIFSLKIDELISGTSLRGMFEERVNHLFTELSSINNSVLFIDDAQTIINNKKNDEYGLIPLIDKFLTDGNIKLILATSNKGYKKIIDSSDNIKKYFQKIQIEEPTIDETIDIINGLKTEYENFHGIKLSDINIKDLVKLSKRYVTDIALPLSAITILDEACALKRIDAMEYKDFLDEKRQIVKLKREKAELIKKDDIEKAQEIDNIIKDLKSQIIINSDNKVKNNELFLTDNDIYDSISKHTNISIGKVSTSDKESLCKLENKLCETVIGQDEALKKISNAIKRSKVGLYPSNRPLFTGLLIGSSGTGKTLTAKTLAYELFGSDKNLVRFDMSEYSDKSSVNNLIGSSAGYVGYENGGLLTEAIKNRKNVVLLLDELEKANESIYNLLLQVFDEGFLTDNTGCHVDFKNTIILMTSNIGVKRSLNERAIGFNANNTANKQDIIKKELKKKFPPEFINRIDEIIFFNDLTPDGIKKIIALELDKLGKRLLNVVSDFLYTPKVIDYIYNQVKNETEYGARPIIRAIQNDIENKIADYIINHDTNEINCIVINLENNIISISGNLE